MATRKKVPQPDPAIVHNEQILRDRQERIATREANREEEVDLGLGLKREEPKTAFAMLNDEWDRKTFGDEVPTYTRILYGPDSLLTSCPELKEQIERTGLEEYAAATAEAIRIKRDKAVPDPYMQKGLRQAIKKFGVEAVAEAFQKRILSIPRKTVEIEADREEDEIFGRPLEDAVKRYGSPGMAQKFLSDRCNAQFGLRGYVVVKNEHGDPVRVGTLVMGEIPIAVAQRRQYLAVKASDDAVRDQEEAYLAEQSRYVRAAGQVGVGSGALSRGDVVRASASEREELLGERLEMGLSIERDGSKAA